MALEPGELDELEHVLDACVPARSVPVQELEWKRDVLRHRPPVVENGVLEDDAVLVVSSRAFSGLPVDLNRPGGRFGQVADDP